MRGGSLIRQKPRRACDHWPNGFESVARSRSEPEIEFMTHELRPLVIPEFALIAEVGDEPAGFILCVPDINVALRHINGRLAPFGLPIGLAKLLYYKSRTRTARLIALGVIEKYRRTGIAEMLVLRIVEDALIKR